MRTPPPLLGTSQQRNTAVLAGVSLQLFRFLQGSEESGGVGGARTCPSLPVHIYAGHTQPRCWTSGCIHQEVQARKTSRRSEEERQRPCSDVRGGLSGSAPLPQFDDSWQISFTLFINFWAAVWLQIQLLIGPLSESEDNLGAEMRAGGGVLSPRNVPEL